jgi:hypothetical protein
VASKQQLVGRYGQLLSKMVHLRAFIDYPQELQASAVLALTQLMAVDGEYCSDNVQVLFTLLHKRWVDTSRCLGVAWAWRVPHSALPGSGIGLESCSTFSAVREWHGLGDLFHVQNACLHDKLLYALPSPAHRLGQLAISPCVYGVGNSMPLCPGSQG